MDLPLDPLALKLALKGRIMDLPLKLISSLAIAANSADLFEEATATTNSLQEEFLRVTLLDYPVCQVFVGFLQRPGWNHLGLRKFPSVMAPCYLIKVRVLEIDAEGL